MPWEAVEMKCVHLRNVHNGSLSSSEIPTAVETCETAKFLLSSVSFHFCCSTSCLCEDGAQTPLPTHNRTAAWKISPYLIHRDTLCPALFKWKALLPQTEDFPQDPCAEGGHFYVLISMRFGTDCSHAADLWSP